MTVHAVLPTRELALAAYPQRELEVAWPLWQDAVRGLRASLRPAARDAQLPAAVVRGLEAAHVQLGRLDDGALSAALPSLRARIRRGGLRHRSAGWALGLTECIVRRHLGLQPYPSQLLAAWLMLDGQLAEMATGEGKTLAAAMASAAAALAGVPVHLITANDYLVRRDHDKLEPLARALGLTSAVVLPSMSRAQREAAYACDIVVLTARELSFDYLRDHLVLQGVRDPRLLLALAITGADDRLPDGTDFGEPHAMFAASTPSVPQDVTVAAPATDTDTDTDNDAGAGSQGAGALRPVLPGLCMAIIDEADSVLLDEASVPLILAAPADATEGRSYERAMAIAQTLRRGRDYELRPAQRRCELGDEGREAVSRAVKAFEGDAGLLRPLRRAHELVAAALSARHALQRDRDYAVVQGKLQLIDEVTGRIADGRQWTGPLQAMVELKEGLPPSPSTRVSAQITYQRFFPRYLRMGGMSGTLLEARRELRVLYDGRIQRVPLAKPERRQWLGERLYVRGEARDAALIERVRGLSGAGRPVLVGTDSVAASRRLSARLLAAGLGHQVLHALQDADEAACVARAGQAGVVTVATNMAGRGTDIALDDTARAAGGLHVIATLRNRSRRIDRQLIGRAARHGDPGSAERWLALDDALFVEHAPLSLRRALAASAQAGLVPAALAGLAAAWVQRRAEARERAQRAQLRQGDRQADETFAFAGGTE